MASSDPTPRLYQEGFRPRHANIGIDIDYQITIPQALPARPKQFNTHGRECGITLNTFNVVKTPNTIVHQFDVNFTGDSLDYTKRVLLKKIWNSKAVKAALGEPANRWIYDTNKLAW